MASLIILNIESRKNNLLAILDQQHEYSIFEEIFVYTTYDVDLTKYPKVNHIRSSKDLGLRMRWHLGSMSKSNDLFVQDDDLIVPEETVDALFCLYKQDTDKVYSLHGRKVALDGSYDPKLLANGNCDFILTRFALFNKKVIPYVIHNESTIKIDKNGEDILLSYTIRSVFNKYPVSIPGLAYTQLEDTEALSDKNDFLKQRFEIINECRSKLGLKHGNVIIKTKR
jgi:hypothetical protein